MQKLITPLVLIALTVSVYAQHDPGRNSVRLLAQDKIEEAEKLVGKAPRKSSSPISDSEQSFVLAMAACLKDDIDAAFQHVKKAVDQGLPIERLQCGPRDVFAPLYAHDDFKTWIQNKQKELLHGPMLGSLTDVSARFWVRTAEESDIQITVMPLSKSSETLTGKARTSNKSDYTATITVSGLKPATEYQYTVAVNGKEIPSSAKFRTLPKEGSPSRFSIAFGGGAGFTHQYERMWTTISKRNLDALLLLGDNVYIDDPEHQVSQRYCYYRRQAQLEWKSMSASTSIFTIYDDHDFGKNDCVPGPAIEKPEWKRKVWKTFTQNWNNPAYGGGIKQPGCWYDFYIGDVHFVMLDCRYYRDLKGGSMLGPVQKKWLLNLLKSSGGEFKVLVSSVPWSPGVKPGSKDTWDGFPEEREEIFSFIETHRIGGVLLMAADRHRSDLRKIERPTGYDLYEMMSSRLTNVHTHGLMENANGSEFIMGYNKECSFGLVEFDTTAEDPKVKYTIVNIDNEEIDSRSLSLSQLSFKVQ